MLAHPWTADEAPHLVGLLAAWPGRADKQARLVAIAREQLGVDPAPQPSISALGPAAQVEALRLMVVLACLAEALSLEDLQALDVLNRQLKKPQPWVGVLRHAQAGRGKRATMALARFAPDGKALLRAIWRHEGLVGVARAMLSTLGRGPANPGLAARYAALEQLPADTLGHRFFTHMRTRGLPLPGEPRSLPERAMHHDLMHVLTGFDTDARGEGRLAGLYAGMADAHPVAGADPFTFVLVGLMTFQLGYDVGPTFVGAERGVVEPTELLAFLTLGRQVPIDVFSSWDFAADLSRPIAQVRAAFGLPAGGIVQGQTMRPGAP